MGFFQPQEEAEFNSGLATIYQLDAIEKGLVEATLIQDYHLHYRMLVAYFKTLCNQTNSKDEQIQIKNWEIVREKYKRLCILLQQKKKKIPNDIIESFDWWEIQLRNLKQKYGLGMPKKDPRYTGTKR